jgi:toxin ParE1/3/4
MRLRFTPRAARDLTDTAAYLRDHSPAAATRVRSEILDALQDWFYFPNWEDANGSRMFVSW